MINPNNQRNAIAQALMNVQSPPPRMMTAQMTPQQMPLPSAPQRPQMPSMGDDMMRRPMAAPAAPPAPNAMPIGAPQMPMAAPPMAAPQMPMGPLPQDQAGYG